MSMDKQRASHNSEPSIANQDHDSKAPEFTTREQKIIEAAVSGKGQWRLYLISLAVLLVVPIKGWEIVRKIVSPRDYGYADYCIPLMIISIHIILFFKVKQRRDHLALIRKLSL
jgi:hypothetical protein